MNLPPMPADPAGALLCAERLVGVRNGRPLWGPLSLRLAAGDALHVQGANGSGKTTLLRTLAGLRPPALGQVRHSPALQAAGLWWLGHALPLAEALDARHNLQHWLALSGAPCDGARIAALLQRLQVPADRPLRLLSAGQRRKAGLAVLALAPRPLWLLDEPFDALDQAGCDWLADLAAAHCAGGGAVVFTAHQMPPAALARAPVLKLQPAPVQAALVPAPAMPAWA